MKFYERILQELKSEEHSFQTIYKHAFSFSDHVYFEESSNLRIERIFELGGGKHVKLLVSDGEVSLHAMLFSTTRSDLGLCEGDHIDLFATLDVNEFRGTQSAQLIVRDFKESQGFEEEFQKTRELYQRIRAGESFDASCGFVPEREDFAHVYTVLRREFRMGHDVFPEKALLSLVNAGAPRPIHYVCLKYILEILFELKICGVEEIREGIYRFDIFFNASRTSIEKSSILKKLRLQVKK